VNAPRIAQSAERSGGTELPDLPSTRLCGLQCVSAGSEAGRDPGRDRRSKGAFLFLFRLG
jgi:hypothetical protein